MRKSGKQGEAYDGKPSCQFFGGARSVDEIRKPCAKVRHIAIRQMLETPHLVNEAGCWIWPGPLDNKGYGLIRASSGLRTQMYSVHRLSYEHFKGKAQMLFPIRPLAVFSSSWKLPSSILKSTFILREVLSPADGKQ